ncbi:MAG: acetamidase/formamidase family protein [Clostridiales bacterium]|nr:acetamidase/formamidase family protein [Clostridiales bacterium]
MAKHIIKPCRETLHGTLGGNIPPAIRIQPGDSIEFSALEADWRTGRCTEPKTESGVFFPRDRETDCGQALCGPVYVEGAKPGMTLAVSVNELVPGDWGWSRVGLGNPDHLKRIRCEEGEYFLTWEIDRKKRICTSNEGHKVPMRPFMGIYAVAPAGNEGITTHYPGPYGGNMDCKALTQGSILYFPVFQEGALFSTGDGHAAQGDGEMGCTAIECPYDKILLSFEVIDRQVISSPVARTPEGWVTFGYAEDLTDATYMALDNMVKLLMELYGFHYREALTVASISVDMRVTQIVNGIRGAHAVLPYGSIIV